jgi:ParB-like chromosome segregation protein Spo0J
LENIKLAMAEDGYDPSQPIIVWEGKNVAIDGHTHLQAANEVGLENIPVFYKSFADEDETLERFAPLMAFWIAWCCPW